MVEYILLTLIPVFDRLSGSDAKIPKKKLLRRLGIPTILFCLHPTPFQAVLSVLLAIILSTDLDEIEDREWDTILQYGLSISFCLMLTSGVWGLLPGLWWMLGVWLSNFGIKNWRLDWKWVEVGRGLFISLSIFIFRL